MVARNVVVNILAHDKPVPDSLLVPIFVYTLTPPVFSFAENHPYQGIQHWLEDSYIYIILTVWMRAARSQAY